MVYYDARREKRNKRVREIREEESERDRIKLSGEKCEYIGEKNTVKRRFLKCVLVM